MSSTSSTRLLILGLVRALGTAHGYLIHGELRSWGAEEWANVKWGSIYHGLRQLAKEGKLVVHEATEPAGRVDYTITEEGEAEFIRLLRTALRDPVPRPDMLAAGLAFLPALRRDDAVALLRGRVGELEGVLAGMRASLPTPGQEVPPHVTELFGMWMHQAESNMAWARGLADRLEGGAYVMADEPGAENASPASLAE